MSLACESFFTSHEYSVFISHAYIQLSSPLNIQCSPLVCFQSCFLKHERSVMVSCVCSLHFIQEVFSCMYVHVCSGANQDAEAEETNVEEPISAEDESLKDVPKDVEDAVEEDEVKESEKEEDAKKEQPQEPNKEQEEEQAREQEQEEVSCKYCVAFTIYWINADVEFCQLIKTN